MGSGPGAARGLAAGAAAALLLLANTAYRRSQPLTDLGPARRLWEDVSVATSRALAARDEPGGEPVRIGSWEGQAQIDAYARLLQRETEQRGIRSWQFWRSVRMGRFLGYPRLLSRDTDDTGRARLAELGFRLLGGTSPYLVLWLGPLWAAPVLLWLAWELAGAGFRRAALVVPLLAAASPYVAEVLSLPYSGVGFYVLALLLLAALVAGLLLRADGSPRSDLARVLGAGLAFTVCLRCRSGTALLLPGFVVALAAAGWRRAPRQAALLVAAFLLIPALLWPRQHHEVWLGMWEGLGDFDRTKGHYWHDPMAKAVLREAGRDAPPERAVWVDDNEAFWRERFVNDVRSDPGWYAAILAKRLAATLFQTKLSPWAPADGASVSRTTSPNEGVMDDYYGMTTTVDFVALGPWARELPTSVLWAPTVLLALLAALALARRPALAALRPGLVAWALLAGCLALAALVSPVLVTTAGALETQAFALVHWVSIAFAVELALVPRRASTA